MLTLCALSQMEDSTERNENSPTPTDLAVAEKEIVNISERLDTAEVLIDVLVKENDQLRAEAGVEAASLIERDGALFRADPADKKMEGPFCILCYRIELKLVPVLPMPEVFAMGPDNDWDCASCRQRK